MEQILYELDKLFNNASVSQRYKAAKEIVAQIPDDILINEVAERGLIHEAYYKLMNYKGE